MYTKYQEGPLPFKISFGGTVAPSVYAYWLGYKCADIMA